jgi:hypothetical protein
MTGSVTKQTRAYTFPRHDLPELCVIIVPPETGGRRECRVMASPMARLQQKKQAAVTTGSAGSTRHSLRDGFNGLYVISPVSGLFSHRRLADHHRNA